MKKEFDIGIFVVWRKYYATTMAICDGVDYRTKYISNPNIRFKGKLMGHPDKRFNVLKLKEEACRVSDYIIPEVEDPDVYILGPQFVCPNGGITLTAQVENGSAPFTYSWRTSSDGFNYGSPTVTPTNSLLWTAPGNIGDVIYFQLTVTTATGVRVVATFSVIVANEVHGVECEKAISSVYSNQSESTSIQVFPNPASGDLNVLVKQEGKFSEQSCSLCDIVGGVIRTFRMTDRSSTLDLRDLKTGMYFISCDKSGIPLVSQPFVIIN